MSRLRMAGSRLLGFFRKRRSDEHLDAEMGSHLQFLTEENIRRGMGLKEARHAARREFGGLEQTKEAYRARRGLPFLDILVQDVRYAVRTLVKSPGFTAVAVLTLALGIGANTAIFSVVRAVLLRSLSFPQANRLVLIWATNATNGEMHDVASYPDFEDWKAQNKSFESVAAFTTRSAILTTEKQAERVPAVQASAEFFDTLGVHPQLGRAFGSNEQQPGAGRVVLLSNLFWKRRFAQRADILGLIVRINEESYTIIGVMPPGFEIPPGRPEEIYMPMLRDANRNHGFLMVLGRLRGSVSISAAQAEMDVITRSLAVQFPRSDKGVGANVVPLTDAFLGPVRAGLLIMLGVVTLVLLIACSNVASVMLARGASRQREMAVRAALGAGRKRLMRQLLTESILLALTGGAAGLLLAAWGTRLLVALLARNFDIPRIGDAHTDLWVLGFTLLVSATAGIVFGILPALGAVSADVNEGLRESSRSSTGSLHGQRIRSSLVVMETALALVLLSGAGVLLKSLLVMRGTAPGFRSDSLLAVEFSLPRIKFAETPERLRFFASVLDRLGGIPGVRSAALVADLPLGGGEDGLAFHIVGRPDPSPNTSFQASFNIASAGYFQTMGIPLHFGREFTERDSVGTPGVVIVNDTAARRFWPGENPLGKQIILDSAQPPLTVVGVAGDVRQSSLGVPPKPEIFLDYLQPGPDWPWLVLVARTTEQPAKLAGTVKAVAASIDQDVPVLRINTMDEILSSSLAEPRVYALLLGVFASLALALAAVGLYGILSYAVTQRIHEMGIRMALGAAHGEILRLVLRRGMSLAFVGSLIGLAGALAARRVLAGLVHGVEAGDPLAFSGVTLLLLAVAFVASYLPARRAARVDPIVALRYE
jgi:putative ABC transport system permease protein